MAVKKNLNILKLKFIVVPKMKRASNLRLNYSGGSKQRKNEDEKMKRDDMG